MVKRMEKHILRLPSGEEISSGQVGQRAILSVKITKCVNAESLLTPGGVCAAMLEAELFCPDDSSGIAAGDCLTLYRGEEKVGVFYAQKPERIGQNRWRLLCYDCVSLLDRDMTLWLESFNQWPCSLSLFARSLCAACGLELQGDLLNGDFEIARFQARNITARQLLQLCCRIGGRFCTADADGVLRLGWYTPAPCVAALTDSDGKAQIEFADGKTTITAANISADAGITGEITAALADGVLTLTIDEDLPAVFTYQGSVKRSDYITAPIDGVRLGKTAADVGGSYPGNSENACVLSGNYLLSDAGTEVLQGLAQQLYNLLKAVQTVPCKLRLPPDASVEAGQILRLFDGKKTYPVYVMTSRRTGSYLEIESTGTRLRQENVLPESQSFTALSGQVTELTMGVEGLKAESRDARGMAAALSLSLEGIAAEVSAQSEQLTRLQQTAEGVTLTVQSIGDQVAELTEKGTSAVVTKQRQYTFDDSGLTIRLEGEQMENRLDHTGMYVNRGDQRVLSATADGVAAVDVTVENYLNVGFSRFEAYGTDRTACFFVL